MDGWNVISEYSQQSPSLPIARSPSLRHTCGEDLSGSLQGAGGIGGLLQTTKNREQGTANFFAYDSNGNVVLLTDAQSKETARYRYDAFGKTLLTQGPAAMSNRYRFSTKTVEVASGLAYYGFRYYSPELGRWVSRDSLGERGSINLVAFDGNNTIGRTDWLGLLVQECCRTVNAGGYAGAVASALEHFK